MSVTNNSAHSALKTTMRYFCLMLRITKTGSVLTAKAIAFAQDVSDKNN
jgi:hypothetical protein